MAKRNHSAAAASLKEWKFNDAAWRRIEITENFALIASERHNLLLGFCAEEEFSGGVIECTPDMEMSVTFPGRMQANYEVVIKAGKDFLAVIEKHVPASEFGAIFVETH